MQRVNDVANRSYDANGTTPRLRTKDVGDALRTTMSAPLCTELAQSKTLDQRNGKYEADESGCQLTPALAQRSRLSKID